MSIDYKQLKQRALEEFGLHKESIVRILPVAITQRIERMFAARRLRVSAFLWMRILHGFLEAYDRAEDHNRKQCVVEALKSLYLARVVSFIRDTLELSHEASEGRITGQAELFHRYRRSLTQRIF